MPPPFVRHPAFDLPDAEELIWRTAPELPPPPDVQLDRAADVRPPARTAVLLTRGEELVLFLRLNFARKRAHETADPTWAVRARDLEDAVVRYNVGLVLSVARGDEEAEAEGLATLVNASRHFDAARGWKFSTYAMRAVCCTISRLRTRQARRAAHERAVVCAGEEVLSLGDGTRSLAAHREVREAEREQDRAERLRDAVKAAGLTESERRVVALRSDDLLYKDIGHRFGKTKEWARQQHQSALAKIRAAYLGEPPPSRRAEGTRPPPRPHPTPAPGAQAGRRSGKWAPPRPPRKRPLPEVPVEPQAGSQCAALLAMFRGGGDLTLEAAAARLGASVARVRVRIDRLVSLGWPIVHVGLRTYALRPL